MGVVIVKGEGEVLRVKLGHPIVSGVGIGIDVWNGVHVPQGQGLFLEFFGISARLV